MRLSLRAASEIRKQFVPLPGRSCKRSRGRRRHFGRRTSFQRDSHRRSECYQSGIRGVAFNGLPSVESLVGIQGHNNTFAAEYGRTGGGERIICDCFWCEPVSTGMRSNITRQAHSTRTHGQTSKSNIQPKIPTHGNNYGFALGGPIYLPKKVFGPIGGLQ
jgi:hypothetical protein